MYVILASKPGQYRTELAEGMRAVEAYDYVFCGRRRAHYVIAELPAEAKVRIVEESEPPCVNLVPTKFLPRFDSLDKARSELRQLAGFGTMDIQLVRT